MLLQLWSHTSHIYFIIFMEWVWIRIVIPNILLALQVQSGKTIQAGLVEGGRTGTKWDLRSLPTQTSPGFWDFLGFCIQRYKQIQICAHQVKGKTESICWAQDPPDVPRYLSSSGKWWINKREINNSLFPAGGRGTHQLLHIPSE